jgi:NADH-quinone oxidoreductase subunit E
VTEREKNFPALLERLKPECERIIAQYEQPRSALLPLMHLFQRHEGYVTPEAMQAAGEMLQLTQAEVEGTVSFYTLLYRKPVGKYMLQICRGLACSINGAEDVMAYLREKLGIGHLETTGDGVFSYEEVECLAACDRASCMQVNLDFVYDLTPAAIDEMLAAMRSDSYSVKPMVQFERPGPSWEVPQDAQVAAGGKSAGARNVPRPDNAGGVGDSSGIIMLDNILARDVEFFTKTSERAIVDSRAIVDASRERGSHAGH